MKLNCKEKMLTFDETPIKDGPEEMTMGNAIANILLGHEAGGKYKMFILAEKFWKQKEVELDEADFSLLRTAVETTRVYINPQNGPALNTLITGQILRTLDGLQPKKK